MASSGSVQKTGEHSWKLTVSAGTDGSGKRIRHTKTVTCTSESQARKELALFVADIEKGQINTSGKMTLNDYFIYWEEHYAIPHHKKKTIAYNQSLFKRIGEAIGHLRLDKIQPKHLLSFYKNLAEAGIKQNPNANRQRAVINEDTPIKDTLSPNTIRKYHVLLHTLLGQATQWQLIAYNPADKVEAPKAKKTHKKIYDEETTGNFLTCLQNEDVKHRLIVLLALCSGMRKSELFGVEWQHIDFTNSTIHICQTSQYLPNEGIFADTTKTESSVRTITIPPSVMELLRQYKLKQATLRLQLGDKWRPNTPKEEKSVDTERLFTTWEGEPSHPDSLYTWLRRFSIRNNLPPITPHCFRHMAATYLITGGVDLRTVAGKLGHANSTTTQLVYSHLVKSAEKETANMMETFIQPNKEKIENKKALPRK